MSRQDDSTSSWLAGLNAPARVGAAAGVTRYLHEVYLGRPDLQRAYPDLDGDDGALLVEWAHRSGRHEIPIPDVLLPPHPGTPGPRLPFSGVGEANWWGVNVAGYLRGALGLGEAARLTVKALDAAGIPALPVELGHLPEIGHLQSFGTVRTLSPPFPVTIACANPDHLWEWAQQAGSRFFDGRHTIGFWWWETLDSPRADWLAPAELLDEIWVGSRHVAEAVAPMATVPVSILRLPIEVPPVGRVDRGALGLPGGFVFLFAFDFNSTLARKNPLGLVEAFSSAFAPGSGASLVVKCFNGERRPEELGRLERAVAAHPDIHLHDRYLTPPAKDALLAACDCYVSLHRAEGFGLSLAEAMYLGKPVIATGFGGNLDFMDESNSYLVGWETAQVGDGARPYPAAGVWAEPDIEHAARVMREVFDDPGAAAERGARAAADIRRTHSPEAAARSARALLRPARARVERRLERSRNGVEEAAAVARLRDLIESGPGAAPARRGMRGLARRALLRLTRPLAHWQRGVDQQLVLALVEAEAGRRSAERRLLDVEDRAWEEAQSQAEALARLRRSEIAGEPQLEVVEDAGLSA